MILTWMETQTLRIISIGDINMKDDLLQPILDEIETHTEITFCGKSCSEFTNSVFEISWSEKGRGFGTYTFFQETKWQMDD
jgi:hypothetical protein